MVKKQEKYEKLYLKVKEKAVKIEKKQRIWEKQLQINLLEKNSNDIKLSCCACSVTIVLQSLNKKQKTIKGKYQKKSTKKETKKKITKNYKKKRVSQNRRIK